MNTSKPVFKILIISDFNGADANVVRDFLFCFHRYSRHDCYYIFDPRVITESFNFGPFDIILLFWSIYLPGCKLTNAARERIRQAQALKLLFLQDEYRDVRVFNRLIEELGVQVIFTCVAEHDHEIFYPSTLIPSLQGVYTVLTGYTPAYLQDSPPPKTDDRLIDIGYRSRSVPYYLGDLGREKTIVAEKFQALSRQHGFTCDISVSEEERIYGRRWVEFLSTSRFTLGSPSGASVVDFTGTIRRNCEDFLILNPRAAYEEVKTRFFADVDGKVVIDTVSPRIFESAALGCTMVMHDGYYGGILLPGRHFIAIKKDYSNIDEVIYQMKDDAYSRHIADNAYNDLIASEAYSYETFVRRFDAILDAHLSSTKSVHQSKVAFYSTLYLKAGQGMLPSADRFISLPGRVFFELFKRVKLAGQNFRILSLYPELRHLLFFYLRGRYWKVVSLKSLLMDLARLGIIHALSGIHNNVQAGFQVVVSYQPEWSRLRFSSHTRDQSPGDGVTGFDLHQFVDSLQAKCALLDWDHSFVGTHLELHHRNRTYSLDMGENGYYRFQALAEMSEFCPELIYKMLDLLVREIHHG